MIVPITSFKSGYWSERLSGRYELSGYMNAASKLENWLPLVQGGIMVRPGTKHCGMAKTSSGTARLIPFIINNTISYVLELGNLYMRFWKDGELLRTISAPLEVVTPFTSSILNELQSTQVDATMVFAHRDFPPKDLVWSGGDTFTFGDHAFVGEQWVISDDVAVGDVRYNAGNLYYYTKAGVTGPVAPTGTTQFEDLDDKSDRITDGTAQCRWLQEMPFRSVGNYPGCVASFSGRLWFASTRNKPQSVWASKTYDPSDFRQFEVINYTNRQMSESDNYYFTATPADARNLTVSVDPRSFCKVGQYLYGTTLDDVALVTTGTKIVAMTATNIQVDVDLVIGKGAQCYSASNWLSPTSPEYENVTIIRDVIGDGDGIEFEVSTGESDRIIDIAGSKYLLIRTATDEITVAGGCTPLTVAADIQSRRGSAGIKAIMFDSRPVFIQGDRKHVREFAYNNNSESYESPDLTFFASDVLGTGITYWDYAQTPDPTLYCVTADGDLAVLVYDRMYEVQAWARITAGNVLSVAVIPGDAADDVYILTEREGTRRVERFAGQSEGFHVDGGVVLTKGSASTIDNVAVLWSGTTISGLSWLADCAVRIVSDGKAYDVTVDAMGVATVPAGVEGLQLFIGIPFSAVGRTMRMTYNGEGGVSQGQIQNVTNIVVRLVSSYPFTVGSTNKEPIKITAPFTGNETIPVPDGWTRDGWVQFQQDNSLPVVITGIMAEVADK